MNNPIYGKYFSNLSFGIKYRSIFLYSSQDFRISSAFFSCLLLKPPILWWGKHYGYFRKSGEKASFGFYILLHSATALTLFRCATVDELARWETIFNDGFAQWREHMDTFESLCKYNITSSFCLTIPFV